MSDWKFEAAVGDCNLFLLLMVLTLESATYQEGPNQKINSVLGWICCGLVALCYVIGFLIEVSYVPYL